MQEVNLMRGQIHMVNFGEVDEMSGNLQRGKRPAIIISNAVACRFSPVISVVPLSTQKLKRALPTHYYVEVDGENNLRKDSVALTEQIITVNRFQIERQTGRLSNKDMFEIDKCLGVSMEIGRASCRKEC